MLIRTAVLRVLLVLISAMFITEVTSSSFPGDDSSNNSTSSNSDSNSTLLDEISDEHSYRLANNFYWLAKDVSKLESELSTDNGPFTIFLPSVEALNDLVDSFPRDCLYMYYDHYYVLTDHMTSILLYHIIQGEAILPSKLVDGQMISTMNGENITIGVNGTGIISIDGVDVKSAMPFLTAGGNILYHLDTALLPLSITDQKSEIIAACDVPYETKTCQGVRDWFDYFAGTQQCASCGGYFQESEDYCSRSNSKSCVPECQWFNDYCTEECCWDTHDQQLELATPFDNYEYGGIWTVAPCDSGVTIKAGWHETRKSGTFQISRTKDCDIRKFARPNSVTPVWHVDCTDLYYNLKCGPIDITVAIWMEDSDGKFVGYYLDPLVEDDSYMGDSCSVYKSIRILLASPTTPAWNNSTWKACQSFERRNSRPNPMTKPAASSSDQNNAMSYPMPIHGSSSSSRQVTQTLIVAI
ncbi:hypothetical protein FRACYDRAFT_263704 [Fragilariopsis cylindrus CCMP1102]|uniref:FAS1 domain-containing protein n=1 Tax=Fragilariopsis cylindrus CCMP1102 TaxID=635003 RepID=A0A1E7EYZ5_9STRA|nr:hypothetical protein FRACYDRAFT_263704 [Fragilariopsis cylindrus CCMP1102]|eukprot:OEU10773.1 hypothetical protein FRACYDRAFT_263704 [Fragilariopsis cylindrus CCMP1102]